MNRTLKGLLIITALVLLAAGGRYFFTGTATNAFCDPETEVCGPGGGGGQCDDGVDNDGDGQVDYPADPGCSSASDLTERNNAVQCDDGTNNDSDGLMDYPADPGCSSLTDTNEHGSAQCDDGIDNDTNGTTDYPADAGCSSAADTTEQNASPTTKTLTINIPAYQHTYDNYARGTVSVSGQGTCNQSVCSFSIPVNQSVTLTANPLPTDSGLSSFFAGWSGDCSGVSSSQTLSMTADKSCTANFHRHGAPYPTNHTLTVRNTGTGTGRATASSVINCTLAAGGSCTYSVPDDTFIDSVSAIPDAGVTATYPDEPGESCFGDGNIFIQIDRTCTVNFSGGVPGGLEDHPLTGAHTSNDNTACTANGWAYDTDSPSTPRPIQIYSDGNLVKQTTAAASGCDASAGAAPGTACSFSVSLGDAITAGVSHSILVKGQGSDTFWKTLDTTPRSINCAVQQQQPPVGLSCFGSPSQGVNGTSFTFTASGGNGTYAWTVTAPASPASASGNPFVTTLSGLGTHTATVTSGGASANCSVTLGATQPALTVSLLLDGLHTKTFSYGQSGTLSWSAQTSSGTITDCSATAVPSTSAWTGAQTIPSGTKIESMDVSRNFTLTCHDSTGASNHDTATANVTPNCSPAGQTVAPGVTIQTLTGHGGAGSGYTWFASGGTPSAGSGATFATSFATLGTKNIRVSSGGLTNNSGCTVTVSNNPTGTVVVASNMATTWSITSTGAPLTQSSASTGATYANQPADTYTITNVPDIAGYTKTITPASSQTLSGGGTITFTVTYTAGASGSVDIKANGSDNPPQIVSGATAILTWTSANIQSGSCTASGGWSGAQADQSSGSGYTTAALSSDTTFTITCSKQGGGQVSDSVTVPVRPTQCTDGIDNDGDTFIDYSSVTPPGKTADPGCTSTQDDDESNAIPQCRDGIDNDGDGFTDFSGNDPGCSSADDNSEIDAVFGQCSDGIDNEGDGFIDYPADPGCSSLTDPSEYNEPNIKEI